MNVDRLQRTLIVGIGQAGAMVTDRLLARLRQAVGPVGIIAGIAVRAGEGPTAPPQTEALPVEEGEVSSSGGPGESLPPVNRTLLIPSNAAFADWRADFESLVKSALRDISRLSHLTDLAQQGLSLRRPDEIHLLLIVDLAESWSRRSLEAVADSIRYCAADRRSVACDAGATGLLLALPPSPSQSWEGESDSSPPTLRVGERSGGRASPDSSIGSEHEPLGRVFDRGCFVAGPANEAGLVVAEGEDLIGLAARFLMLLVASPLAMTEVTEANWSGPTLASFGLAAIRWPGPALAEALSGRWAGSVLRQLLEADEPGCTPVEGVSAQQLASSQRLAPLLLAEGLATRLPPLPDAPRLADLVPDPPWPWLFGDLQTRLEAVAQRWEEDWQMARQAIEPALAETATAWQIAAGRWLADAVGGTLAGALPRARVHLAAMTDLLATFADGVEARLEEAEADLVLADRQAGTAAGTLIERVAALPTSPLATLLRWGPRPLGWIRRWAQCRHAQDAARRYAHLLRAQLAASHTVWLYQELLPFYQKLAADWQRVVKAWDRAEKALGRAAQSPRLTAWPDRLKEALAASSGPWTMAKIEEMYQEALASEDLGFEMAWAHLGLLDRWVHSDLAADEIVQRLADYANDALRLLVDLPVDLALARALPDEEALAAWLAAFVEQASPFWPYDEAALDESARAQVRLESWLFVPGAERSPLARLCQAWPRPPHLLQSHDQAELVATTVRQGVPFFSSDLGNEVKHGREF